jgi:hypothetical protein
MQEPLDPLKDPTSYTWLTYAWVLMLSALGGFVSFARRVKAGQMSRPWGLAEFIGEVATAAFTGLITFYLCEAARLSPLLTAAFVGISGHMGSRAIYQFEMLFRKRFSLAEEPKDDAHK